MLCSDFLEWAMSNGSYGGREMNTPTVETIVIYFNFYILLVESAHNKYSEITIIYYCMWREAHVEKPQNVLSLSICIRLENLLNLRAFVFNITRFVCDNLFSFLRNANTLHTVHTPNSNRYWIQSSLSGDTAYSVNESYVCINKVTNIIDYYNIMKHVCWSR